MLLAMHFNHAVRLLANLANQFATQDMSIGEKGALARKPKLNCQTTLDAKRVSTLARKLMRSVVQSLFFVGSSVWLHLEWLNPTSQRKQKS